MYSGTVERFVSLLEQSVLVRTVPELFVAEVEAIVEGEAFGFFGKASPPFRIPVARQC